MSETGTAVGHEPIPFATELATFGLGALVTTAAGLEAALALVSVVDLSLMAGSLGAAYYREEST